MIDFQSLAIGDHRLPCPTCARGPKDKALSVRIDADGRGVAHCFRCEYVAHWRDKKCANFPRYGKRRPAPVARANCETLSNYGREIWRVSTPIHGPARAYLEARRCVLPPADGDLRCHLGLKHPSGYIGPALVALVTDAVTREPLTLHRTWIKSDGNKADIDPPRMLLGGHRKQGGVIRLWPDECVTQGLAIAEGIETALSVAHAYKPAWSCIDAGNLADLPVLPAIESLVIARDRDPAGMTAAAACADRWTKAGREVRITRQSKNDLNDVLRENADG